MNNIDDSESNFRDLQAGFCVFTELEDRIDDDNAEAGLGAARSHISSACQNVDNPRFDSEFSKAMGMVASLAVSYRHDELAERAIKYGDGAL